jgi:hypothetical protein
METMVILGLIAALLVVFTIDIYQKRHQDLVKGK